MIYENLRKAAKDWRNYMVTSCGKDFAITEYLYELGEIGMHNAWYWGTLRDQNLLAKGKITEGQFKARAIKQVKRIYNRGFKKDLEKITAVEKVEIPERLEIWIEWKKSKVWGGNPQATIKTGSGVYRATATGCGYDKESAAVGQVLNACPESLAILYSAKDTAKGKDANTPDNAIFGYNPRGGSIGGYPVPSYRENGAGIDAFKALFVKLGYRLTTHTENGATLWEIEKKKRGVTV